MNRKRPPARRAIRASAPEGSGNAERTESGSWNAECDMMKHIAEGIGQSAMGLVHREGDLDLYLQMQ